MSPLQNPAKVDGSLENQNAGPAPQQERWTLMTKLTFQGASQTAQLG